MATTTSLVPGQAGSLYAAQGAVHCSVDYQVSARSPVSPTETYVLAALDGLYNELFNARICAFTRCAASGCLDWTTEVG
jgi:Vanin C-terminal domain